MPRRERGRGGVGGDHTPPSRHPGLQQFCSHRGIPQATQSPLGGVDLTRHPDCLGLFLTVVLGQVATSPLLPLWSLPQA